MLPAKTSILVFFPLGETKTPPKTHLVLSELRWFSSGVVGCGQITEDQWHPTLPHPGHLIWTMWRPFVPLVCVGTLRGTLGFSIPGGTYLWTKSSIDVPSKHLCHGIEERYLPTIHSLKKKKITKQLLVTRPHTRYRGATKGHSNQLNYKASVDPIGMPTWKAVRSWGGYRVSP